MVHISGSAETVSMMMMVYRYSVQFFLTLVVSTKHLLVLAGQRSITADGGFHNFLFMFQR